MTTKKASTRLTKHVAPLALAVLLGSGVFAVAYLGLPNFSVSYDGGASTTPVHAAPRLDTLAYDTKLLALAHIATSSLWYAAFLSGTTTVVLPGSTTTVAVAPQPWPVRAPYPRYGALLPAHRVVAYYGNFFSTGMGVLGEYPEEVVLDKLRAAVAEWEHADPTTPVIPAIEYIDVTAQGAPGKDGKYRLRMPDNQIDKALAMAGQMNGIVILDIQVGLSTLPEELPLIRDYLAMPNVHVAIDPEFSMHNGEAPGTVIGTFSAEDINYAAQYLAQLVDEYNLPPKILIVHRFTEDMVTNYKAIKPLPEVQIVMNMDGWGYPAKKLTTYYAVIAPEPVQFTGIKLFYKNDTRPPSTGLLSTTTILGLTPAPIYVQYQ